MKTYLLKLYQYNVWANERVLKGLQQQVVTDEKILTLMGHIVAAQLIWLHRIKGLAPPDVKLWGPYSIVQLERLSAESGRQWFEYVEQTETFDLEITYKNYAGEVYSNRVEMIMIHVVNHASYHRGQIALLLRQKGFEPVGTDFIMYDREIRGWLKE